MDIQTGNLGSKNGGIQSNCGPTAVANLVGQHIDTIMDTFRTEFGLSNRWGGRSNVRQCLSVIEQHGKKVEGGRLTRKASLKNTIEWHCKREGKYFIRVGNHFVAVINQVVCDQWQIAPVREHRSSRKMVTHIYEVK